MATRMVNANRRRNRARAENRPERWPGDFAIVWDMRTSEVRPSPDARRKFYSGRGA